MLICSSCVLLSTFHYTIYFFWDVGGRLRHAGPAAWATSTSPPREPGASTTHASHVGLGPGLALAQPGPWACGRRSMRPGRERARAACAARRGAQLSHTVCTQHIERLPVCNIHDRCTNTGNIKEIWENEPHGHTERRRGRGRASGGGGGGATRPTAESVDLKPRDAPQYAPSARGLRGTTYSVAAGWGAGPAGAYRHA